MESASHMLDFRFWTLGFKLLDISFLVFGLCIWDSVLWALGFGFEFWTLGFGLCVLKWILDCGLWFLEFRSRLLHRSWPLGYGLCVSDFGHWIMESGLWILDVGLWGLDLTFWTLEF